jgi:hypothetical protein
MIQPIVISAYGETLEGYPNSQVGDEGKLSTCVGVHQVCQGFVDINKISLTHCALNCRLCKFRIVIPNEVKTYGDLRAFFKQFNGASA